MSTRVPARILGATTMAAALLLGTTSSTVLRAEELGVSVDECAEATIARGVQADLSVKSLTTGKVKASGEVDGVAKLEVCATLTVLDSSVDPTGPTIEITPGLPEVDPDGTTVCLDVGVKLRATAGATGKVTAKVSGSGGLSLLGASTSTKVSPVKVSVPFTIPPRSAGEEVVVAACVSTAGSVSAS